ncbi:biopolymer transporter Tol [Opitutaceae bacterium TAV5]|nr:biopolymer transporter Tol [Opitutaceae bacterium TAV5]
MAGTPEYQVTHSPCDHILTNIAVWSPDGQWIAYDVRPASGAFTGSRIERVNTISGRVEILYAAPAGSHCGVVTWSPANPDPARPRLVFIQGPEPETPDWTYAFSRRRGVILELRESPVLPPLASPLEALNHAPPFTPGALRGGSHAHTFSGDGQWVSFTCNDNLLASLDALPASARPPEHDPDQRNIGISIPATLAGPDGLVRVNRNHPRNLDADRFSVIVSHTVAHPRPGSDEINRAIEDAWIGVDGYRRGDGTRQRKAVAFLGQVVAPGGHEHAEVFVLDLPENPAGLTRAANPALPLEGTATTRPGLPAGVVQRRITFTDHHLHPGVATTPRHWPRSSPDGEHIAFLMCDDTGIIQFWLASPRGGLPRQLTRIAPPDFREGVSSAFSWSPDGRRLAAVIDGSVCLIDATTGGVTRLAPKRAGADAPLGFACVLSPDGRQIAFQRKIRDPESPENEYAQIFVVGVPE